MANVDYYQRWLQIKEEMKAALAEDQRIQSLAISEIGIKPQGTAVEVVARVYAKFCELYNKLCDCYDQMEQAQRRSYIKKIIDALTCRILELKRTLEEVEVFEYTYPENALQQLLIVPHDIQIMCPFFYPFEIRQQEMQYVIDQIFAGNRIGDPTPTPSEIERREELRLEEEERRREEKEAEIKRKLALGEEIIESADEVVYSPQELEQMRLEEEYNRHISNIQRMERSRYITREKVHKFNKDTNLYLELAGLKAPPAKESLRIKAAQFIQNIYRKFMKMKRDQNREMKVRELLGMVIPAYRPPSAKEQLERVKEVRREFRRKYYTQWMDENVKEKSRVLRLREGDIMDDISAEVREWFSEWYKNFRVFDEFPWAEEGGSILVVRGETFTLEEYVEWRTAEEKRLKAEAGNPKSKEQIKAEKIAAKLEKKRLELDAKEKEKKRLLDYKKARLNPDNDPGIFVKVGQNFDKLQESWNFYQTQWKDIDTGDAALDVIRGYIKELVTENAYQDVQLQLRPIVDEMMRIELIMLKTALKNDYAFVGEKIPITQKRKRPRKQKNPKPDKLTPAAMFQRLVDEGIIRKYPHIPLDDYWGDQNYAAADQRAVLWTPAFPPPSIGDVREQVRVRCLLALGATCEKVERSHMIVGPKGSGKKLLVYAVATETNSILIDLSPMNVYDKFPGPKNMKTMFQLVNKVSRLMQPTVILVDKADKLFYKKVPKEEKMFDPTRLQRDFFKEIIKPITGEDKILVLGTAEEPWLSRLAAMYKVFPSLIMIPRSDYGSLSCILTSMLMKYHGVKRDFNFQSVAQTLRGYGIDSIRRGMERLLTGDRVVQLYNKPLMDVELINAVMDYENAVFTDQDDNEMYTLWYQSYSPWGEKYLDYMHMLESQLVYKLKAEKKKK